jgi:hypothetical protein
VVLRSSLVDLGRCADNSCLKAHALSSATATPDALPNLPDS